MTHDTDKNLNFGEALEAVKQGKGIRRAIWPLVTIYLNKGSFDHGMLGFKAWDNPVPDHPSTINGIKLGLFESGDKGTVTRLPSLTYSKPNLNASWSPRDEDLLASDWEIVSN